MLNGCQAFGSGIFFATCLCLSYELINQLKFFYQTRRNPTANLTPMKIHEREAKVSRHALLEVIIGNNSIHANHKQSD